MAVKLLVSELFYSLQGEGPESGTPALFLRLGGCNLRCPGLPCDTLYSVSPAYRDRWYQLEVGEVVERLQRLWPAGPPPRLVVTGGEPLLQPEGVGELLRLFPGPVTIETNGTLLPRWWGEFPGRVRFGISPKLSNSGEPRPRRWRPEVLRRLGGVKGSYFKVVLSPAELPVLKREVAELRELSPGTPIYCMPQARTRGELEERAPAIARFALEEGYCYSDRLQLRLGLK